jgi:uncharacterized SAM-binding protein YcdF (DUF218 family)
MKTRLAFVARTEAYRLGCAAAIALVIGCGLAFTKDVSGFLLHRLTYVRHLPESASTHNDVVYVLGGTADSLEAKFRTASKLIRDGKVARVLVLSQQAVMTFDPALGRNLTADEWVVENLGALGITAKAIEFVAFEEGFFGTWSEAKGLSRLVRERGYRRLILVTSAFHSRRVWESFSRTIEQPDTSLFLYLSDESAYRRHLLPEYVKLLLYRALLF